MLDVATKWPNVIFKANALCNSAAILARFNFFPYFWSSSGPFSVTKRQEKAAKERDTERPEEDYLDSGWPLRPLKLRKLFI